MSGGSRNQTSTQTNEPYSAARPLFDRAMGDALHDYRNNDLMPSLDFNTAIPFSSQSRAGMNAVEGNATRAMRANPLQGAMGGLSRSWANGGLNGSQQTAMDALMPTARGDFLNRADPNFERILANTKQNAGTEVGSMMSGMGRFGGGAHQGILADRLGNIEADARLGQYNMERDRQADAAGQVFGMGQTGYDNLAGAGDTFASLFGGMNEPGNALMGIGAMNEDYAGRQMNDRIRRADRGFTELQALLGIANGTGAYGTTTAQTPRQSNGFSNILGGGLGLASLLFGG